MRKQPLNLTADPAIRATFQAQLAEARETAGLSRLVRQPAPDLYPRYSGYYRQLSRLPRRVRRALQRQWKRSLSALALLLALGQVPALAATINVDGTNCTLADAIRSANTNTAVGGCTAGSGADRLVLAPKSTHTLATVEDTTYGDTGLPLITSTVTIAGRNSTIERGAGAPEFRILAVASSGDLTLHRTTVSGGTSMNSDAFAVGGGGLYNSGILTLTNSTLSGNTAYHGGGLDNHGTLTLSSSIVAGNTADRGGGLDNHGTLTLSNSTVSDNRAIGNNNGSGGGVNNGRNGILTLTNSTVSGNAANSGGGGVRATYISTLSNSTIFGNTAGQQGGGVDTSGNLTLSRSLVSGNTAPSGPEVSNGDVYYIGTVFADDFNLFGHNGNARVVGFSPGPTDLVPSEGLGTILNTTLANNGGPTRTHALVAGSPAIDAVGAGCPPPDADQRGMPRPQGPACDIGAFEADSELVLFRKFAAELEIDLGGPGKNNDDFELSSFITLGAQSDGLDPEHETLVLKVGPATITLPAGALRQTKDGQFKFRGRSLEGAVVKATLQRRSGKRFEIHIEARRVEFGRTRNPFPVSLTIGDDTGSAQVDAEFD